MAENGNTSPDLVGEESSDEPYAKCPRLEKDDDTGPSALGSEVSNGSDVKVTSDGDGLINSLKRSDTVEYTLEAEIEDGSIEGGRAEVTQSEVMRSEVPQSEVTRSEVTQSEVTQSEVTRSEVIRDPTESGAATQEYNMDIAEEEQRQETSNTVSSDAGDSNVTHTEEPVNSGIPSLMKIPSVMRDAELIAEIVDGVDIDMIYENLKKHRGNPNRVDLVTNGILETVSKVLGSPAVPGHAPATFIEDFVSVIDKSMANMSALPLSADEIHQLLQNEGDREDRVDRVVSKLLTKQYHSLLTSRGEFAAEVQKVTQMMPGANPNEVFDMLQQGKDLDNRVDIVVGYLQGRTAPRLTRVDTLPNDPSLRNDPLYRDMRIVAKVLPDMDPNEIYAFLEAHHDQKNRIQLVIEELMRIMPTGTPSSGASSQATTDTETVGVKIAYTISDEVDELKEIFPDCDPAYLYDELQGRENDEHRVRNLALSMFENKNYPKHREILKQKEQKAKREQIDNLKFDLKEFLLKFPDPCSTFENKDKSMGDNYQQHVRVQIRNDFRELKTGFLESVMEKNKFHYIASQSEMKNLLKNIPESSRKYKLDPRAEETFPVEPDEFFFYEKMYLAHKADIEANTEEQKGLLDLKKLQAEENGEFLECGCCFDSECLIEDMASCADGHLFCKDCIKRSSEVAIGDGKCDFPCLTENCDYKFPLSVLQTVMSPNMFSILLRKMQEEEIKQAAIPDLVSCPFCSFATIISNPHDKVFKCLNPECLKDSCRLCGEPDHVPLHCDEIEKQGERSMRTYIETCVSEAMLRQCPNCKKRFFKEFGCNKMTCTCSTTMCYLCQQVNVDYEHFDDNDEEKCSLYANARNIHIKEMTEAVEKARLKYMADHPEATDTTLVYDPHKHIEELAKLFEDDEDYDPDDGNHESDDAGGSDANLSSDNDDNWRDSDDE